MDFNYSAEDEAFRGEFRAWLKRNAPHHTVPPLDGISDEGEDDWSRKIGWYRKLAAAGTRRLAAR